MPKSAKRKTTLSPFMLTLAAMTGWAAAHEPGVFTTASVGVWQLPVPKQERDTVWIPLPPIVR